MMFRRKAPRAVEIAETLAAILAKLPAPEPPIPLTGRPGGPDRPIGLTILHNREGTHKRLALEGAEALLWVDLAEEDCWRICQALMANFTPKENS